MLAQRSLGEKNRVEFLARFAKDQSGAAAMEYGLIAGLIAVVIITGVPSLGQKLSSAFTNISSKLPVAY